MVLIAFRCEIDPHFLETPDYSKFFEKPRKGDAYVFKEMSVFKFPGDGNVVFQCRISLCDVEGDDACKEMIVSFFAFFFVPVKFIAIK